MKRNLAWLLCLVLLSGILLTACSGEKDALVGTWTGSVDFTQPLNEEISAELGEELSGFFRFQDFVLSCDVTFTKKGTYSITFQRGSVERALAGIQRDMERGIYAYVEDLIEKEGFDLTVEEYMDLGGTSMDALLAQTFTEMNPETLTDELLETSAMNGNFAVRSGKLMLSEGTENRPDPNVYHTYTLEGDQLTISRGTTESSAYDSALYPLNLTRAG